jgi:hypothetical protein
LFFSKPTETITEWIISWPVNKLTTTRQRHLFVSYFQTDI